MPFDALAFADHESLEKIERVIGLISTPAKWCKGAERNRSGQYCIRGAMIAADALESLEPVVLQAIHDVAGRHFRRIEEFNDHPRTTHGQVIAVLDRARTRIVADRLDHASIPDRNRAPEGGWLGALRQRFSQRHRALMGW